MRIVRVGCAAAWMAAGMAAWMVVSCAAPTKSSAPPPPPEPAAAQSAPVEPDLAASHEFAAPAPTPVASAPAPPSIIHLPGGIDVDRAAGEVRMPAFVATTQGWLEAVVCGRDSREHESLLVVDVKPSQVHAALLALGIEPGAPGQWSYRGGEVQLTPPRGAPVVPIMRWRDDAGEHERPLVEWIHGQDGRTFPGDWVFAGSRFITNPRVLGPGEHYEADFSGSLVGLVTFGDETIAAVAVIPDQVAVEEENWQAWTDRMPPEGTAVVFVLRRVDSSRRP